MAKNNTVETYSKLMTDISAKHFSPVYLLMGEESFYIDKVYKAIVDNALSEEEKDFNLMTVYGADVSAQQIMDQCRRYPMMAQRQVVIIREAQGMKDLEALERYMDKPVQTTILVICYMGGTIDSRKKILSKANAVGNVLVSESPRYDSQIVTFITDYLKNEGRGASIDQRAAQVVAAHIGGDLKRLSSELDKVLISFSDADKRVITPELVEQKIGISKNYNVFELRDALIQKDALKAQRIAKYFDDNPKAGGLFALLPLTFSFFQNLMLCYYAPRPVNESAIMAQLGLRSPYQVRDYIAAMRNYPAKKTIQIISKLREVDARSKGLDNVSTPPGDLLKELISFILH